MICIYNDTKLDLVHRLSDYLTDNPQVALNCVVVGELNAHHPLWEPSNPQRRDRQGRLVHELIVTHNFHLQTPADFISFVPSTSPQNPTTIDLLFSSDALLVTGFTAFEPQVHHGHDHRPYCFLIDDASSRPHITSASANSDVPHYNTKNVDWDEFNETLKRNMNALDLLPATTASDLDNLQQSLTYCIDKTQKEMLRSDKVSRKNERALFFFYKFYDCIITTRFLSRHLRDVGL